MGSVAEKIRLLADVEACAEDRLRAATELSRELIGGRAARSGVQAGSPAGGDGANRSAGGILDGVRRLGAGLQAAMWGGLRGEVEEAIRLDHRWWRLLAKTVGNGAEVDGGLADAAADAVGQMCAGGCLEGGRLAEGVLLALTAVRDSVGLGVVKGPEAWVGLLGASLGSLGCACARGDGDVGRGIRDLGEFLFREASAVLGGRERQRPVLAAVGRRLYFDALRVAFPMSGGRACGKVREAIKAFLAGVVFHPAHLTALGEVCAEEFCEMYGEEAVPGCSGGGGQGPRAESYRHAKGFLQQLSDVGSPGSPRGEHVGREVQVAVASSLGWMMDAFGEAWRMAGKEKDKGGRGLGRGSAAVPFCVFTKLALITLPVLTGGDPSGEEGSSAESPSSGSGEKARKRKRLQSGAAGGEGMPWCVACSALADCLEAVKACGAYRPGDDPSGCQKEFLDRLAKAVLYHYPPMCSVLSSPSKRPRGVDVPLEWTPAGAGGRASASCSAVVVMQVLLELDHRVVQPHLETVWLVIFGAAGVASGSRGRKGGAGRPPDACGTAAQLVKVYSQIRQLDVLFESAAACVRAHRHTGCMAVLCSREFVSAVAGSVSKLPIGQTSRFVHWVSREIRELTDALPDAALLALGELLDCVLQNLSVDLTNAVSVGLASKAVVMTDPVKHLVSAISRRGDFGDRPVFGTVLLRLYNSSIQLHAACVDLCPLIESLPGQALKIDREDRLQCPQGMDTGMCPGGEYFQAAEIGGFPGQDGPTLHGVGQALLVDLKAGVFPVFVENRDWGAVLESTLAGCILHRMSVLKTRALCLSCACPEVHEQEGPREGTWEGAGFRTPCRVSSGSSTGSGSDVLIRDGKQLLSMSSKDISEGSERSESSASTSATHRIAEQPEELWWSGNTDDCQLHTSNSTTGCDSTGSSSVARRSRGRLSTGDVDKAPSLLSEVCESDGEWNLNACEACLDELTQLGSLLLRILPPNLDFCALRAAPEPQEGGFFGLTAEQSVCWIFNHMCETFSAWGEHCAPDGKVRFMQQAMAVCSEGRLASRENSVLEAMRRAADCLWSSPAVYEIPGFDMVCHFAFVRRALEHLARLPKELQEGEGGSGDYWTPIPGAFNGRGPRSPGLLFQNSLGKWSQLDLSVQLSCQVQKLLGLRQGMLVGEEAGGGHPVLGHAAPCTPPSPTASELKSLEQLILLMCMFPAGYFNSCSEEAIHAALSLGKMLVDCLVGAMSLREDCEGCIWAAGGTATVAHTVACLGALFRWMAYLTAGSPQAACAFPNVAGGDGMLWLYLCSDAALAIGGLLQVYDQDCDPEVCSRIVECTSGVVRNVMGGWLALVAMEGSDSLGRGSREREKGIQTGGGFVRAVLDIITAQGWGDTVSEKDVAGCFLTRTSPHVVNVCMLRSLRVWLVDSVAMALCRAALQASRDQSGDAGERLACLAGEVSPVRGPGGAVRIRAALEGIRLSMADLETTIVDHFMSLTEILKCIAGIMARGGPKQGKDGPGGAQGRGLVATHQALLQAAGCLCSAVSQCVGIHALQPYQSVVLHCGPPPCLSRLGGLLGQVSALLFGSHSPLQFDCRMVMDRVGPFWAPGTLAKMVDFLRSAGAVFPVIDPPAPVDLFINLACIHLLLFASLPLDAAGPDPLKQTSNSLGGLAAIAIDPPGGPQLRRSVAESLEALLSGGIPGPYIIRLIEALERGVRHAGEPALAYVSMQGLLLCLEIRRGAKIKHHIAGKVADLAQGMLSCINRLAIVFEPAAEERERAFLAAAFAAGLRALESMIATQGFAISGALVAQAAQLGNALLAHSGADADGEGPVPGRGLLRWGGRRGACLAEACANLLTAILRHKSGSRARTGALVLQSFRAILIAVCAWERRWARAWEADAASCSVRHGMAQGGKEERAILSRCALAMSVVAQEVARGGRGVLCVTMLGDYLAAVAKAGPWRRPVGFGDDGRGGGRCGVLREMRGAALELFKVLGRAELQHLHAALGREGGRRALAELREEYKKGGPAGRV